MNHFNELERGLPHISRTLLAERLRRLEQVGVLERRGGSRGKPTEYRLTLAGRELQPIIDRFEQWGARWAFGRTIGATRTNAWNFCASQMIKKLRLFCFTWRKCGCALLN